MTSQITCTLPISVQTGLTSVVDTIKTYLNDPNHVLRRAIWNFFGEESVSNYLSLTEADLADRFQGPGLFFFKFLHPSSFDTFLENIHQSDTVHLTCWSVKTENEMQHRLQKNQISEKIPYVETSAAPTIFKQIKENLSITFDQTGRPQTIDNVSANKQSVRHSVVTGAPGIGKTRLGREVFKKLQTLPPRTQSPIYIRTSFANTESPLCPSDSNRSPSQMIGMRAFWWNFYAEPEILLCWQAFQTAALRQMLDFNLGEVLEFITSKTTTNSPLPLPILLHIDEINALSHMPSLREFFQDIGSVVTSLYPRGLFVSILVTGTGHKEKIEESYNFDLSNFKADIVPLPLPRHEDFVKTLEPWIAQHSGGLVDMKNQKFQSLVAAVSPLPRAFELLLYQIADAGQYDPTCLFGTFFELLDTLDASATLSTLSHQLSSLYARSKWVQDVTVTKPLLALSFSGVYFPKTHKFSDRSLSDLEHYYGAIVHYHQDLARIELPFALAAALNDEPHLQVIPPDTHPWIKFPKFIQGVGFEDVDGVVEEMRSSSFQSLRIKNITAGDYYHGAVGTAKTKGRILQIPRINKFIQSLPQISHVASNNAKLFNPAEEFLPYVYPGGKTKNTSKAWHQGYIIQNGDGAPTADIIRVYSYSRVIVLKQHKHSKYTDSTQNPQTFWKIVKDSHEAARKTFEHIILMGWPDQHWTYIFVFVCNWLIPPEILAQDKEIPPNTLIFHNENLGMYYPPAFFHFEATPESEEAKRGKYAHPIKTRNQHMGNKQKQGKEATKQGKKDKTKNK